MHTELNHSFSIRHRNRTIHLAAAFLLGVVSGCSSDEPDRPPPVEQTVFRSHVETINKAKAVEQTLLDAAGSRANQIDQQN